MWVCRLRALLPTGSHKRNCERTAGTARTSSMWKLRDARNIWESHAPSPSAGKVPADPDLSPEDIDLVHGLWLELSEAVPGDELRHSDVVTLALQHLQRQFEGPAKDGILDGIQRKHALQSGGQNG